NVVVGQQPIAIQVANFGSAASPRRLFYEFAFWEDVWLRPCTAVVPSAADMLAPTPQSGVRGTAERDLSCLTAGRRLVYSAGRNNRNDKSLAAWLSAVFTTVGS